MSLSMILWVYGLGGRLSICRLMFGHSKHHRSSVLSQVLILILSHIRRTHPPTVPPAILHWQTAGDVIYSAEASLLSHARHFNRSDGLNPHTSFQYPYSLRQNHITQAKCMITFDGPCHCHPSILRLLETERTKQVIVAHQYGSFIASSKQTFNSTQIDAFLSSAKTTSSIETKAWS